MMSQRGVIQICFIPMGTRCLRAARPMRCRRGGRGCGVAGWAAKEVRETGAVSDFDNARFPITRAAAAARRHARHDGRGLGYARGGGDSRGVGSDPDCEVDGIRREGGQGGWTSETSAGGLSAATSWGWLRRANSRAGWRRWPGCGCRVESQVLAGRLCRKGFKPFIDQV